MDKPAFVVSLTVPELEALIDRAVAKRLAAPAPVREVLTKADVAELLGCDERSITTYVHEEGLPALRLAGKSGPLRFLRRDVMAWLERRKVA